MDATATKSTLFRASAMVRALPAVALALIPLVPRTDISSWVSPTIATGTLTFLVFAGCWPGRRPATWAIVTSTILSGCLVVPSIGLLVGSLVAAGFVVTGVSKLPGRATPVSRMPRLLLSITYATALGVTAATPRVIVPAAVLLLGLLMAAVLEWREPSSQPADSHDDWLAPLIERAFRAIDRAGRMDGGDPTNPFSSPRGPTLLIVGAIATISLTTAIRDTRSVPFDDAAITFRYAWRIAHGYGFTYNDGDPTNGASAPLYTWLLAFLNWYGLDVEVAAKSIGAICYASSCALAAWLGSRLGWLFGAILAPVLLLASTQFRLLALSGMESAFAVTLGLCAICAVISRRDTLAGFLLGLALVNKLDAGFLALGVAAAWMVFERRPPIRLAVAAILTALPWFAFATIYFGSPIPYSATQKLGAVKNASYDHDPLWILHQMRSDRAIALVVLSGLALVFLPRLKRASPRAACALLALVLWGALHLAWFSFVNLGDPYSWYITVIYPVVSLGAATFLAQGLLVSRKVRSVPSWVTPTLFAGIVAVVLMGKAPQLGQAARVLQDGHRVDAFEHFEATRRDAGRFLAEKALPGEVIQTCFGWIAYGAPDIAIEETCPLSTRKPVATPTWGVEFSWPGPDLERLPPTVTVERVFVSDGDPVGETFVFRFDPS